MPENTLGQLVCRIFTFDLFDLLMLIPGVHCYIILVFFYFLKFGSLVFLEIAYNVSLQQCLTSSRGEIHEKYLEAQICTKRVNIGPEIRIFAIFPSLYRLIA